MNEQLQSQIIQLVKAAMQGNQEANQQIQQIAQAAQQGDQRATAIYQYIEEVARQMQGTRKAKQGTKLDYIKSLKTICKEGEELVYLKAGGQICPKCQKKKVISEKCGGAAKAFKAKRKMQQGDKVSKNDTIHVNGQPRSLVNVNGPLTKKYPALSNGEYQKLLKSAKAGDKEAQRKINKQKSVQQ